MMIREPLGELMCLKGFPRVLGIILETKGDGQGRPRLSKRDEMGLWKTNGIQGVQKEP